MLNVILAGVGFIALAWVTQLLKRPLMSYWQRGGMWGIKRTRDQAEESHHFLVRFCLFGGLLFVVMGLGGLMFDAVFG
jgi:hypothetical protein